MLIAQYLEGNLMRNVVVALFCIVYISACSGPVGPIAGGTLEGTPAPWPEDWSFTNDIENVLLQTNPDDPYSVTIWMVVVDGQVYIASVSHGTRWAKNISANDHVVLSVHGKLINARANQVTSAEIGAQVVQAYLKKYDMEEEEFVEEDGVLFHITEP